MGRLFRLAPQLTELMDHGAREYGMGFARGRVLWALQASGPVVMRALSQQLGISPRTVTGLIDALEADGWVTRSPHPEDRRATIIAITPASEAALAVMREGYEGLAHDLLAGIDPGRPGEVPVGPRAYPGTARWRGGGPHGGGTAAGQVAPLTALTFSR